MTARFEGAAARSPQRIQHAIRTLAKAPGRLTSSERSALAEFVGKAQTDRASLRRFMERAPASDIDACDCSGCRYIKAVAAARPWTP